MNYRRAMTGTKRVLANQCCGTIIDYQDYLAQLETSLAENVARLPQIDRWNAVRKHFETKI